MTAVGSLVEHLFRHAAGRMVGVVTRMLGPHRLGEAEEVVQDALLRALETWPYRGVPDNPAGWLMQVARNRARDQLRRDRHAERAAVAFDPPETGHEGDGLDDELAMILMCCHPAVPAPSRLPLTLKTVGGFGVREIAAALLLNVETVQQRIVRAKRAIRESGVPFEVPRVGERPRYLGFVLDVLYLLFNEGYRSHDGDALVRPELCHEAIRLGELLAQRGETATPELHALLALMSLQASRLPARTRSDGVPVLLQDQDRTRWDRGLIARGLLHLDQAGRGGQMTALHVEAGIAACHATAPSFEATDWTRILAWYDDMIRLTDSPVVRLNRSVAVAMVEGIDSGIAEAERLASDGRLAAYGPLPATLGELYRRAGRHVEAVRAFERASALAGSEAERRFLVERIMSLQPLPGGGVSCVA